MKRIPTVVALASFAALAIKIAVTPSIGTNLDRSEAPISGLPENASGIDFGNKHGSSRLEPAITDSFCHLISMLNRLSFSLLAIAVLGCDSWPPREMYTPKNVPANAAEIDPWIATLLNSDVANATRLVKKRLKSDDPELTPIIKRLAEFTPCQIALSSDLGHVRCVRQYLDVSTNQTQYDALYLVQPPETAKIKERIEFFDGSLRPTMMEFLSRFAGSGEEMIGTAGNFAYDYWPTAEEFGYADENSLGTWKEATLFYHSLNGDAVFIKPNGATAWRVLETDETIPIAQTFAEFIELYSEVRATHEIFDSWAYRDFKAGRSTP